MYNRSLIDRRIFMPFVTISPKFQVVIPKAIREKLGLTPGQRVETIMYDNRIELIPVRPIKRMKGFLKGIDTRIERDADRI
jgi:AbrB family looped-hinge helix DNA binding protein